MVTLHGAGSQEKKLPKAQQSFQIFYTAEEIKIRVQDQPEKGT